MNKRIEELAEQAGNKRINDYYTNGTVTAFTDIQLQKFAELIVEDIMQELFINGYEDAFDHLNKYFGVE